MQHSRRTLIKGASIITMDALGDLPQGDILVTGDSLTEISPAIHADDAQVIDGAGFIVIPGLVNAHKHTWQTALRGLAANWTLLEYFQKMHAGLATVFEPQDLYIATLFGSLNQLNGGTTTLADWCHNNPTPAHNDAAITARPSPTRNRARRRSGRCRIRATDLNMQPVIDPVNSVVMQTSLANIDSVMVAGKWKKRHGQLLGVELAPHLEALRASSRKIIAAMAL